MQKYRKFSRVLKKNYFFPLPLTYSCFGWFVFALCLVKIILNYTVFRIVKVFIFTQEIKMTSVAMSSRSLLYFFHIKQTSKSYHSLFHRNQVQLSPAHAWIYYYNELFIRVRYTLYNNKHLDSFFLLTLKDILLKYLYAFMFFPSPVLTLLLQYSIESSSTGPVQLLYYPSIHHLYPLNPLVGSRGGWSLSQWSSGERQGTPWTGRQSYYIISSTIIIISSSSRSRSTNKLYSRLRY